MPGVSELFPLGVGQLALDRLAEHDRLVLGGPDGVPHQRDDEAFAVPADGFVDDLLAIVDAVPGAGRAEAEILSEDGRIVGPPLDDRWQPQRTN